MSILQRLAEIENSIKKLNDKVTAVSAVNEVDTSKRNDLQQNGNKKGCRNAGQENMGVTLMKLLRFAIVILKKEELGIVQEGVVSLKNGGIAPYIINMEMRLTVVSGINVLGIELSN